MKALEKGASPILSLRIRPSQLKELKKLAGGKSKLPAYIRDVVIQHHLVQCGGIDGTKRGERAVSGCQQGVFANERGGTGAGYYAPAKANNAAGNLDSNGDGSGNKKP